MSAKLNEFRHLISDKPESFWEALLSTHSSEHTIEPDNWDDFPDIPLEQFDGSTNKQTDTRTKSESGVGVPLFSVVSGVRVVVWWQGWRLRSYWGAVIALNQTFRLLSKLLTQITTLFSNSVVVVVDFSLIHTFLILYANLFHAFKCNCSIRCFKFYCILCSVFRVLIET